MAPNPCIAVQLRQLIYYHLDNNNVQNAIFFAERFLGHDPKSAEATYLMALCHFKSGDNASAIDYSKPYATKGAHLGLTYVYAQACLALEQCKEGIIALERNRSLWASRTSFGKHTDKKREINPDASVCNNLLGKLYYAYGDHKKAITHLELALKLNPYMWDAFTLLCDMGQRLNVGSIYKISSEMMLCLRASNDQWESQSQHKERDNTLSTTLDHVTNRTSTRNGLVVDSAAADPFNTSSTSSRGFGGGIFQNFGLSQKLNESSPNLANIPAAGSSGSGPEPIETPTGPSTSNDMSNGPNQKNGWSALSHATELEPPQAPPRKSRAIPGIGVVDFSTDIPKMMRPATKRAHAHRNPEGQAEESAATQALRTHILVPAATKRTVSGHAVQRQSSEDPGAPQRRSARLLTHLRTTTKLPPSNAPAVSANPPRELKKARPPISKIIRPNTGASTVGRQVSGNRKPVPVPVDSMDVDERDHHAVPPMPAQRPNPPTITMTQPRPAEQDPAKQEEAMRFLLDLNKKMGSGYYALSQYRCEDAIAIYNSLRGDHPNTPWVLSQIAKAYYELASYSEAHNYYQRVRRAAPSRLADMEIYSTILWHLKKDTELSFLAHELIDAHWDSPQAWCALGNAMSLSRDHEQALKCFKRSTQLDRKFAYAFTLQGHEHVANEEYDKALSSYRQGIAADPRHYNAWYGVGRVYDKQGDYVKALSSFNQAARINPTNAVLVTCIGTVYEKQKEHRLALEKFSHATLLAPKSTLTRFKKARALMALGEMNEALRELMILKDQAPDEAMIHFLLGRLYKILRQKGNAVRHFTIALNLDPKASQQIKDAIENLEDEEGDDASMMA